MGKFNNLKTFPQGLWGPVIFKCIVIRPFSYAEQNDYLKNIDQATSREKGQKGF